MVGIIIKQKFFEGGPEPQEKTAAPTFDPQKEKNEADQLYAQALQLKSQARKKQAAEQDSSVEYKAAISKLKQAREKYDQILERIRSENQGQIPNDYRNYEVQATKIQQALADTVKMKGF